MSIPYYERLSQLIEKKRDLFIHVSDEIWSYAETRYEEVQSAEQMAETLEMEGFEVEREAGGISTAVVGSCGNGSPVIAILGEYDALFNLSQEKGISHKSPIENEGNGHGCGHNLLGTGALAAAVILKDYMLESGLQGTIRFYGCPAEEGGGGKGFMVRAGLFDDVDAALTWHPGSTNHIQSSGNLATCQIYFTFNGRSSHAAASPHLGRSALDAVELMNLGANFLREHLIQDARLHYAITNSGGKSPNVVQPFAEVLYKLRAPEFAQVQEIYERVLKIAEGAALMTETELDVRFDAGSSNLVLNKTLESVMFENFQKIGLPNFTEQEQDFAKEIQSTFSKDTSYPYLSDELKPYKYNEGFSYGSTDVGDVSWLVPTAQCSVVTAAVGTPFHTWQVVSQGGMSIGHKGMLHAGKVLAATAVDLLVHPGKVKEAKEEHARALNGRHYLSPLAAEAEPQPIASVIF
ncbi:MULTISPECIES: M20 family metallopeptidase [Metabacillus]|uniref:M20 family metallopeptidase n=1 Tax=Metabacillus hrfriensis TaxID=3048891 RepID=A0ACD4RAL6_9BACI|nr:MULTISPECIES: M20 family metallopeptidase [Metabacillus]UAL51965.1 amidohydrolase [Metabacillus dongyingensis]USK28280.1 M20 family metallopeptidase [Bacillus sp. CMF21]WHZ57477.1 M20 family metallopeptidase [Metabacillus sp. CT-WN-B3]